MESRENGWRYPMTRFAGMQRKIEPEKRELEIFWTPRSRHVPVALYPLEQGGRYADGK